MSKPVPLHKIALYALVGLGFGLWCMIQDALSTFRRFR